jgi:hypothetical protein
MTMPFPPNQPSIIPSIFCLQKWSRLLVAVQIQCQRIHQAVDCDMLYFFDWDSWFNLTRLSRFAKGYQTPRYGKIPLIFAKVKV